MRILLTEGSGLTSRQVAGRLGALGHHVGVLSSDPMGLTRFTRSVRAWHRTPAFGPDPHAWLDAALAVYREHRYDVLFPTQEQVTVLSASPERLRDAGVVTAVPPFAALAAVQDKVASHATLARLGLPQPAATVLADATALAAWDEFPVFVKSPIGTATSGVRRVDDAEGLAALGSAWDLDGVFADGGLLAQRPVAGPLAMVQAVFADGRLVAFHANRRERLGVRGGASHKCSVDLPAARTVIETLGRALGWHGALSADVILTPDGPVVNRREPPPGRTRQRAPQRRGPGGRPARRCLRRGSPRAGPRRPRGRADPSAPARRPRRGRTGQRPPRCGRRALDCRPWCRVVPSEHRGADPGAR